MAKRSTFPYQEMPEHLRAARGLVAGVTMLRKFGHRTSVSTSFVPVWSKGAAVTWLTSAGTVDVVSNSANDDAAGSHAQKVTVEGLDSNWAELTEEVSLTGSGTAQSTGSFIRVNRAYVSQVGTYGNSNAAVIEVQDSAGSNVLAHIPLGDGQTQQLIYTVPAGKTLYVTSSTFSSVAGKPSTWRATVRFDADVTASTMKAFRNLATYQGIDAAFHSGYTPYIAIPAKSDIVVEAKVVSGGTGDVAGDFEGYLVG